MKELRHLLHDEIKSAKEQHIPKEKKMIATLVICRGHKFYQLNKVTQEITEAEFDDVIVDIKKPEAVKKQLIIKPEHLYTSALNKKNALKHFKNMIAREKGYPV